MASTEAGISKANLDALGDRISAHLGDVVKQALLDFKDDVKPRMESGLADILLRQTAETRPCLYLADSRSLSRGTCTSVGSRMSSCSAFRTPPNSGDKEPADVSPGPTPRGRVITGGNSIITEGTADGVKFSRMKSQTDDLAAHTTEVAAVRRIFRTIDVQKQDHVRVSVLVAFVDQFLPANKQHDPENKDRLREAVVAINELLGDLHPFPVDRVSLETFKVMMLRPYKELEVELGKNGAMLVFEIRGLCAQQRVISHIQDICNLGASEEDEPTTIVSKASRQTRFLEVILEPIVAIVIICNAVTIGVSLDIARDWDGWKVLEVCYTAFFIAEMMIKIKVYGWVQHFLGADWSWNWFDCLVVTCALVDTVVIVISLSSGAILVNLSSFTVIRLVRLVRITRLVRLLRLKMFQELTLMVNGVIGGLKTLFWAMIFLLVLVYTCGILMRQLMDPDGDTRYRCAEAVEAGLMTASGFFPPGVNCNRGAQELDTFGVTMFGDVAKSMTTVFQCFTDGCNSPSGWPLIWVLWETEGAIFITVYYIIYIFATFGIFNLILAIFVENTLAYAHSSEQKRVARKHEDNVRHAKKLKHLLVHVFTMHNDSSSHRLAAPKHQGLLKVIYGHQKTDTTLEVAEETVTPTHLSMRVDHDQFEAAMETEEVQELLEDLDVSCSTRDNLFEILDADGNGYLALSELAEGIMRLRGPADKGDVVSSALMVRCLQKSVRVMQDTASQNQTMITQALQKTLAGQQWLMEHMEIDNKLRESNQV